MKKIIIILISIFVLGLIVLGIIFVPSIKQKQEINKLKKEVLMVNDYINSDKGNINYIRKYIKKSITSNNNKLLEKAIDNYLNDILKVFEDIKLVNNDLFNDSISIDFSKDNVNDKLLELNNGKDLFIKIQNEFNNINENKYLNINDKKSIKLYNDLLKNLNIGNLKQTVDISNLEKKYQIYEFLINNKEYYNIENSIVFLTRSKLNEFNTILNDSNIKIDYKLIDDNVGPVINAYNIVITEGDSLTINDKISCIDEVDDVVACNISGSFNNNQVGDYTLNISAKDSSNNVTSKDINIIVKEKQKYNLPYVVEVIRNQSTTIVYGKDANGEYTNIVGVFPCSPGAGNNTPVGTFYSRRGVEWGGLFGNVYGQYSTVITGHVLFHSVPYYSTNKDALIWEYYNKLGTKVSMGCIRLTVRDAKWLFDNCPSGTMIKIYDGDLPAGISKPEAQKIDGNDPRRGWDPTDPDPANPWNN